MIELQGNRLAVSFPEVHPKATCALDFQRTLRIPDDNQDYPLPAGLGQFPVFPVDDYAVPEAWKVHGGVFLPMYQSEALWINFGSSRWNGDYPFAIKIAAGKINAITGEPWSNELSTTPQSYVVVPEQPWLDGFSVSKDIVRQFVAMPLGAGYTAEEQLSGDGQWGGLQLIFYPMKAEEYQKRFEAPKVAMCRDLVMPNACLSSEAFDMGLAPGGRIRQSISKDPFGIDVWDTSVSSRCYVHLLNSERFRTVTGANPPSRPITAEQYATAGIPWFDYYGESEGLEGSSTLAKLDGIGAAHLKKGTKISDNVPIRIASTVVLKRGKQEIRDGAF